MKPLEGMRVVNLSINLPGPTTAARLHQFGAEVVKIEPPSGDPLGLACRAYYDRLTEGHTIVTLDLKNGADRAQLDKYLDQSDLLLTAHRTAALERLGLGWRALHARFPRLCHVAIVGHRAPNEDVPGHDLTFQASCGLLAPPQMPKTLVADLGAAEQAVSAALGLLLARARGAAAGHVQVPIAEAGEMFAWPIAYGITVDGALSGALPSYGIYEARGGYIALAALERQFLDLLEKTLGLRSLNRHVLEQAFATRSPEEWETWGREHGIPIAAVR